MARRFHQVPIHIGTPEPVLSVGPFTLTARHFLLLLLGCSLSYHCWQLLAWLSSPTAQLPRAALAMLPAVLAGCVAFFHPANRPLEQWGLVLLRFLSGPRLFLWHSLRHEPDHLLWLLDEDAELSREVLPDREDTRRS